MSAYEIDTSQTGPHHDLLKVVRRYKITDYRRPIPHAQTLALEQVIQFTARRDRPLIIDSGCGTGHSTKNLAQQFPDHVVIGIDKSAHRLARAPDFGMLDNALLVRADLCDLWRLLEQQKLRMSRHYVLHPNPWPKIGHLKRRFHAHPVFKTMVRLAPYLEVRTNWRIYADELMMALTELGQRPELVSMTDTAPITLFEKKYLAHGSEIFIVKNNLT